MSTFTRIFGSLSALFSNPLPPTGTNLIALRYATLINLFQLLNKDIFDVETDIPTNDDDIQTLAHVLRQIRSPAAEHLTDTDWTKVTSRSHFLRGDAAHITFVEYTRTIKEVGEEDCAVILISTFETNNGTPKITPHFSMSGKYQLERDNKGMLFIPLSTICLGHMDGEDIYYAPTTTGEFMGAIAYANDTFLQLLSDTPITYRINQKWMQPENYATASKIANELMSRTAHSLADDIKLALK